MGLFKNLVPSRGLTLQEKKRRKLLRRNRNRQGAAKRRVGKVPTIGLPKPIQQSPFTNAQALPRSF